MLGVNQDKIYEFIVLANGTTVKNPLDNTATATKATPIEGLKQIIVKICC